MQIWSLVCEGCGWWLCAKGRWETTVKGVVDEKAAGWGWWWDSPWQQQSRDQLLSGSPVLGGGRQLECLQLSKVLTPRVRAERALRDHQPHLLTIQSMYGSSERGGSLQVHQLERGRAVPRGLGRALSYYTLICQQVSSSPSLLCSVEYDPFSLASIAQDRSLLTGWFLS